MLFLSRPTVSTTYNRIEESPPPQRSLLSCSKLMRPNYKRNGVPCKTRLIVYLNRISPRLFPQRHLLGIPRVHNKQARPRFLHYVCPWIFPPCSPLHLLDPTIPGSRRRSRRRSVYSTCWDAKVLIQRCTLLGYVRLDLEVFQPNCGRLEIFGGREERVLGTC